MYDSQPSSSTSMLGFPELRITCWTSWPARVTPVESPTGLTSVDTGTWDFLFRNSSLRLASLLWVEGLFLFFTALAGGAGVSWLQVDNLGTSSIRGQTNYMTERLLNLGGLLPVRWDSNIKTNSSRVFQDIISCVTLLQKWCWSVNESLHWLTKR